MNRAAMKDPLELYILVGKSSIYQDIILIHEPGRGSIPSPKRPLSKTTYVYRNGADHQEKDCIYYWKGESHLRRVRMYYLLRALGSVISA
jgi:hypothetical protein